jgi:aminoglycoside/choline kinase family phosphotransferase
MDAPPGKEDCRPFLHVAGLFAAAGAHVPKVHAENLADGFLLLEDLGGTTYLDQFKSEGADASAADRLYAAAIDALVAIQRSSNAAGLAPYDKALLERELALFPDSLRTRLKSSSQTISRSLAFTSIATTIRAT